MQVLSISRPERKEGEKVNKRKALCVSIACLMSVLWLLSLIIWIRTGLATTYDIAYGLPGTGFIYHVSYTITDMEVIS